MSTAIGVLRDALWKRIIDSKSEMPEAEHLKLLKVYTVVLESIASGKSEQSFASKLGTIGAWYLIGDLAGGSLGALTGFTASKVPLLASIDRKKVILCCAIGGGAAGSMAGILYAVSKIRYT
jgi:hypothetical protein